ncbi:MAG: AmmeMemoRadiSam system radical SAM enzyme [Elusimicrobia bacterium RIFOXYB2_FULL_49_7]|nr:MAG: AmmeMemoRadiSam system radical SAM enzyme [Elusimicrobia bacterium RIFOXYB2_FULL_49_7]
MREAMCYDTHSDENVQCDLCAHHCLLAVGDTGRCRVRRNERGKLMSMVYADVSAVGLDPIEKKPLFHFLPGSETYSIATLGCNFRCSFCQNAALSQAENWDNGARRIMPAELVEEAVSSGTTSISYTYSEPTVFFEYAYDCGQLARRRGLKNIFVTNGFMGEASYPYLLEFLDAANIDLKSFREETYRTVMGGRLRPVLENIRWFYANRIHLEVTTLLVPGLNDSENEIREMARFLVSVSPDIPWHISRFHPDYRMTDRPKTAPNALLRARDIGREEGLAYVYTGNLDGAEATGHTECKSCGKRLITRVGYQSKVLMTKKGTCHSCGERLYGVFE